MKTTILILSWMLWIAPGYAQETARDSVAQFVTAYDICFFSTVKDTAEKYQVGEMAGFVVDSTNSFDMVLRFQQPLSNIPFKDQKDPIFQGGCIGSYTTLILDRFQIGEIEGNEAKIIHSIEKVLIPGYWGLHFRARRKTKVSKPWDPIFFLVTDRLLVPMIPVFIKLKVVE